MLAVVQRVSSACCIVGEEIVGRIGKGMVVLLAVGRNDGLDQVRWMAKKIANLRIFEDKNGKMNLSLLQIRGEILLVPQFTLYGDCSKGYRPSFTEAAPPEMAEKIFLQVKECLLDFKIKIVSGIFGARMKIKLTNEGPVTLIVSSKNEK